MRNSKYTKEFRDSTVQLVMNTEQSVLQIAAQNVALARKDLDVNPKTIYNWIREYKKVNHFSIDSVSKSSITNSNNIKETASEELRRLRAENKLLKQERDILKKIKVVIIIG